MSFVYLVCVITVPHYTSTPLKTNPVQGSVGAQNTMSKGHKKTPTLVRDGVGVVKACRG